VPKARDRRREHAGAATNHRGGGTQRHDNARVGGVTGRLIFDVPRFLSWMLKRDDERSCSFRVRNSGGSMAEGIRALMALAVESQQPLPFRIAISTGGSLVSGIVAPWWLMHDVTISSAQAQVEAGFRRVKDEKQRAELVDQYVGPLKESFAKTRKREEQHQDEVTLYDAAMYPTVGASGAQSGGVSLPVVRVPISAIDAWWVMEGKPIKGTGGFGIGVGFLLPIGDN
jgi:hypothetical protein